MLIGLITVHDSLILSITVHFSGFKIRRCRDPTQPETAVNTTFWQRDGSSKTCWKLACLVALSFI